MRVLSALTVALTVVALARAQEADEEGVTKAVMGWYYPAWSHHWNEGIGTHWTDEPVLLNIFSTVVQHGQYVAIGGFRARNAGDLIGGVPNTAIAIAEAASAAKGTTYKVIASPQSGGNGAQGRSPAECRHAEQTCIFYQDDAIESLGEMPYVDSDASFYINPICTALAIKFGHDKEKLTSESKKVAELNICSIRLDADQNRQAGFSPNRLDHELARIHNVVDRAQESLGKRPQIAWGAWFADCDKNGGGEAGFNAIEYLKDAKILNTESTRRDKDCVWDMIGGDKDIQQAVEDGVITDIGTVPLAEMGLSNAGINQLSKHEPIFFTALYTQRKFEAPGGTLLLVLLAMSAVAGAIIGGAYYARQKAIESDELLYGGMSSKGSLSMDGSSKGGLVAARPMTAMSGATSYTRGGAPVGMDNRVSGTSAFTRGDALGMNSRGSRSSRSSKSKGSRSSKSSKSRHSKGSRSSGGKRKGSGNRMTGITEFTRGGPGFEAVSNGTRATSSSGRSSKSKQSRSSRGSKGSHASRKSRSSSGSKATMASKATRSSSGSGSRR